MVNVLNIKALRDLWSMRTQVLSIALLIGSGIAVLVMSASNYRALIAAMESHYTEEHFGDVFASLKRAPQPLIERVRLIDGIAIAESRVAQAVRVLRPDTDQPISGRIISVPAHSQPLLNRLHLVEGSWIDPTRSDEVMINEAYARARLVHPGDLIDVVLNGRLQSFRVAGVALSPEFVFATRSALPLPDDRNLVILWASEEAVAGAFDMHGAFNDVVVSLAPGALAARVIDEMDQLLAPYGGIGAYGRSEQPSHRFLQDELAEQETLSIVMPIIFFGIAAFLLNIILTRLVEAQREQIASLKALGFEDLQIASHYFKLVTVIALLGSAAGILLGWWFAVLVIESYRAFFRFPDLEAQLDPLILTGAVALSILIANAAAASAVFRVVRLAPAEAMRPQVPATVRSIPVFIQRATGSMSVPFVMALRTVIGRPLRTLFTIFGIALAVPLVLFGLFWFDAINHMIDVSFGRIERGDAILTFATPVSAEAIGELRSVPGILLAEGQRTVTVQIKFGHQTYRTALNGVPEGSELKVPRDKDLNPIDIPSHGIMLSRPLAEMLNLKVGDVVEVEVLEDKRPSGDLEVIKLSDDILGFSATMTLTALNRFLREGDIVNAAVLKVDPTQAHTVWRHIRDAPKVEASSVKALWLVLFNESIAGMIVIGAGILTGFGLIIAMGVVYNSARVAFHERAWELASLRILGFTNAEVAAILISELAFEVLLAVPLGLVAGYELIRLIVSLRVQETFQIPVVIAPESYAWAALIVLGAAIASALAVRRRIVTLDLVAVLKTRD